MIANPMFQSCKWVLAVCTAAAVLLSAGTGTAQPVIVIEPASQAVWPGSNATFAVVATGTGPLAYCWQFNGTNLPVNVIATVAGGGISGDGAAATNASLTRPQSLVVDSAGQLLIADTANNRIRKVDTKGIISTVAGGGSGGDGGWATNAALHSPGAVALGPNGTLYIADTAGNRIRCVDANGVITTVAGTGTAAYAGDGAWATNASLNAPQGVAVDTAGDLFIADTGNNRIRKVDGTGLITTLAGGASAGKTGDGGWATNALLNAPTSLGLDAAGNLFIADRVNHAIRKVDPQGIMSRVAGNYTLGSLGDWGPATNANLWFPTGVAVDAAGNLFIADTDNQRIRQVDPTGLMTTVAGRGTQGYAGDGGVATNALLNLPSGVAVDGAGNLFVADQGNSRVRRVAQSPSLTVTNVTAASVGNYSVVVTSAGGSVPSSLARLELLGAPVIVSPPGNQAAWVGSNVSFSVQATGSTPLGYQWYWNGATPVNAGTNALLPLNAVSPGQAGSYTVVITNSYGSLTSSVAALTVNQLLSGPTNQTVLAGTPVTLSVQVSGGGPLQYQWQCNGTNIPNNIIRTVAGRHSAGFSGDGGPATNATLYLPGGIHFDSLGNLYIADGTNRIRRVDTNGLITTVVGNGTNADTGDGGPAINASISTPNDLCFDAAGNLYIGETTYVRRVDTNGTITTVAGNGTILYPGDGRQATNAAVYNASGLCTDGLGRLYIAEYYNNRVCRVDTNGIMTTVAGTGSGGFAGDGGAATAAKLNGPTDVVLDAAGNLYITDSRNYRVRKVDLHGFITTVAGNGQFGYSGDGGPATAASLNALQLMAVDGRGNLYIADCNNNRIRKVDTQGIITTVVGTGNYGDAGDGGPATNATLYNPYGVTLDAAGNLFLSQGGFASSRVREVMFAGTPTLTLNNPALADAGTYQVIITSPSGSVTSQVATLTVQVPPSFTSLVTQANGTVALSLTGTPNSTNRVWVTTNLAPPVVWWPLSTNVAGPDGTWQCTDSNPGRAPARFYRATLP